LPPTKFLLHILFLALIAGLIISCATPAPFSPTATPKVTPEKPFRTLAQSIDAAPVGAPKYAAPGPYPVGLTYVSIPTGDSQISVTISLPVDADAAAESANAPYPLIIFSQGLGGGDYSPIYNHLASYGFVVMSGNPRGENATEFWAGAATRILDTKLLLDYAELMTAPGGQMAGLIDIQHTAIFGHSSGGWAALVEGGAQFDFSWCSANPDLVAKQAISNCPQFISHQDEIAQMLGLKSAPVDLWPQMNDPRIKAVVAAAPDGDVWGAEYGGVANMNLPVMIITGSADEINPPELCAYPIYAHLGSAKKSLVVSENMGHGDATPSQFALITHYWTAFFLSELKGDAAATEALLKQNANIPGAKFETTVSQ
jgi:predicted dienelactone hydrolase